MIIANFGVKPYTKKGYAYPSGDYFSIRGKHSGWSGIGFVVVESVYFFIEAKVISRIWGHW